MFALLATVCLAVAAFATPIDREISWDRIVGGHSADEKQFPHMVSLQVGGEHLCGGAIIDKKWVLTSAHCVIDLPYNKELFVKAGSITVRTQSKHEQFAKVDEIFVHEQYDDGFMAFNDIALLRLSKPFEFNDYVNSIPLPEFQANHTRHGLLSGWGSITPKTNEDNIKLPDRLHCAYMYILSNDQCQKLVYEYDPDNSNMSKNICTEPSTCYGDNGSPLIREDMENHRFEIIGLVSHVSSPCGYGGMPAIYTRVSAYTKWIARTISENP